MGELAQRSSRATIRQGRRSDPQQPQRPHRIGALQAQWRTALRRQRFRQDEKAIEPIGKAQAGGDPERQPRIDIAEHAAERRAQDEAGAERDADLAEHRRALVRRGDVGDIGKGGGDAGRGDARHQPADEQPPQRRRQRHQHIVGRKPEIRQQHHRAAAKPVGQRAEDRREEELHHRPGGAEHAEHPRGARGIVVDKALDQPWQNGNDDAERQRVEQDGDENEDHRRALWRRSARRTCGASPLMMAACACGRTGLAFSRSVIRTGVPGSSNASRSELTR